MIEYQRLDLYDRRAETVKMKSLKWNNISKFSQLELHRVEGKTSI